MIPVVYQGNWPLWVQLNTARKTSLSNYILTGTRNILNLNYFLASWNIQKCMYLLNVLKFFLLGTSSNF